MFIRLTSILLIFVLLSASCTQLVFFAGYQLNKEYISKVHYENKAKPRLTPRSAGKVILELLTNSISSII